MTSRTVASWDHPTTRLWRVICGDRPASMQKAAVQGVRGRYPGHLGWSPLYASVPGWHQFPGLRTARAGRHQTYISATPEHPWARDRNNRGPRAPAGRRGHLRGTHPRQSPSPSFPCRGHDPARPRDGACRRRRSPGAPSLFTKDLENAARFWIGRLFFHAPKRTPFQV